MKTQDALIEILTEELPPKPLRRLSEALANNVSQALQAQSLNFSSIKTFATPRRLALIIEDLEKQQADREVERRGPAIKAAYDAEGRPTKACEGFCQSSGITLEQVKTLKTDKGEWLVYHGTEKGKQVEELLPEIVSEAVKKLPIPKLMRWGNSDVEFVRPVHAVSLLFGRQVLKAEILGQQTANLSFGHRFHYPFKVKISSAKEYESALKKAKVIADFSERRELIKQQVIALAAEKSGAAIMPDELLDEVTSIVEWPQAIISEFDKRFLDLPREVLITVMQQHQKYFAVEASHGHLLPYFITVSNIKSKDPQVVAQGNRRVIRARFADAEFFYRQDQKTRLFDRLDSLKNVLFQKQLGSLYDKTQRVVELSKMLAPMIQADVKLTERAALLCKTDLMTNMVGEFPELQGIMGRYYATREQEASAVAMALDEQYMPRFAGDALPKTAAGQALAIADRVDTLVGIFGINKAPSGDKDPFALRRATLGVLRLAIEKRLDLDLFSLIEKAVKLYGSQLTNKNVIKEVLQFIQERHKQLSLREGFSAEIFMAVAACDPKRLFDFQKRLEAVKAFQAMPDAASLAAANKRVSNILSKQQVEKLSAEVDEALLQESAEKDLFALIKEKQKSSVRLQKINDYAAMLKELATLRNAVDQFFNDVMVMAEDEALRHNRLALLSQLRQLFLQVADVSLL